MKRDPLSVAEVGAEAPLILHSRVVRGAGGGPEKTILNSCRYLEAQGFRAACAYLRHPEDPGFAALAARAQQQGVDLRTIDDRGPLDWRIPGRFRRLLDRDRPAIWHGHDYKSNLLGLLLRRSDSMRLVTTVHGWVQHTWKTPLYYAIDRWCIKRYEAVICVSRDLQRECLRLGIAEDRCRYVPNGIDVEQIRARGAGDDAKSRSGVDRQRLIVGAVGRLSAEKGFENLILAFDRLVSEGLDAELWIVGEGDLKAELQALADDLACRPRVKLLGFRADVLDLYRAMDVFVLSSIREGLPNVLLEAMASEVPVLATRVAGVPSLIRDNENGLVVEIGSVESLFAGLMQLARDPGLRQRLAVAGRRTVEADFSFARRMSSIIELYNELLER